MKRIKSDTIDPVFNVPDLSLEDVLAKMSDNEMVNLAQEQADGLETARDILAEMVGFEPTDNT